MKLRSLDVGPFRSYTEKTRLDLSTLEPGLYLVSGDNGSGKSTLFDAVYWALYGVTPRGLRAGNVSPWAATKKGARVSINFADGPAVVRTWSPNSLQLGGTEVDQSKVDAAFGSSLAALNTWYFSQLGSYFVDLPAPDRMSLYGEALSLDFWDRKSADAQALVKSYSDDVQAAATDTARAQEALSTLQGQDIETDYTRWEQEREEAARGLAEDLEKAETALRTAGRKNDAAKAVLEAAKRAAVLPKALEDAVEDARESKRKADTEVEVLSQEEQRLSEAIEGVRTLGANCNHCGQKVTKDVRQRHLKELTDELSAVKARIVEADKKVVAGLRAIKEARAVQQDAVEQAREALEKARRAAEQARDGYNVAEGFATACRRELAACRAAPNPFEEQRRQHARSLAAARSRLATSEEAEKAARENVAQFEFWAKAFKDIRLQVLRESLDQLNAEVNEALHELGLPGWRVDFEVEQETKSGTVRRGFLCAVRSPLSPEGLAVPWEAWSGGESQALRVGIQLGTANMLSDRLGLSHDFEFWDEPSRWLLELRVKDLLGVLQDRAYRYGRRVFIAEHRSLDFDFDGVLRVKKDEAGSSRLSID